MKLLVDMTEAELRLVMNNLANNVVATCANSGIEKPMFTLLLWNDPAVAQYISNCERADVIKALRECAARLERNEDVPR